MNRLIVAVVTFAYCLTACQPRHRRIKQEGVMMTDAGAYTRADTLFFPTGWYRVTDSAHGFAKRLDKYSNVFYLGREPFIPLARFALTEPSVDSFDGTPRLALLVQLDKKGTALLADVTKTAPGTSLALVIHNRLIAAATISGVIRTGRISIYADAYTADELEQLAMMTENEKQRQH